MDISKKSELIILGAELIESKLIDAETRKLTERGNIALNMLMQSKEEDFIFASLKL